MPAAISHTYTFWKDHFRYFVAAEGRTPDDPRWDTDGATGDFVFPPTDGVVRWRLPSCLEVIAGKEAGELDVDVSWLGDEPVDAYTGTVVASACDLVLPTGRIVIADSQSAVIGVHDFGDVRRVRVLVVVTDRDVSGRAGVRWGEKTAERHHITAWPAPDQNAPWTSAHQDDTARTVIRGYQRDGIDPAVGEREP